ncbi:MAG: hypothetical protein ACQRW7_10345 [Caulobacterales bacterium]|uniref:hypothetical protein n=1 Tax=Glycocaulis sp. TaxID=1969725 RepID=UPI003F9F4369
MILQNISRAIREQNYYAVVLEFVIVIAGVVIGFQINAWNEARGERARERVYLAQLIMDLEADAWIGQTGAGSADQVDAAANRLLTVIEGGSGADAVSDAALIVSVPFAGYAYLPLATDATYEEMISTGALSLVRDSELKRALASYYSRNQASRQWDSLLREEQYAYRAATRGLLTREQYAWARASIVSGRLDNSPDFDRAAFIEAARARPAIIDSLRSMGAVQERLRGDSRTLQQQAEILGTQLQTALGEPRTERTTP